MLAGLRPGRRNFIHYVGTEDLWHERLLVAPGASPCWSVITPTLDTHVEENDSVEVEVILCGPMNGIPVSLRKASWRLDEDELREHKAEWILECEALAAADRRAAGLDEDGRRDDEDPSLALADILDGDFEDEEGGDHDAPAGPLAPLEARPVDHDDEVWIALEARAGFKLHAAVLMRAAGHEFVRLGDRGVVRRRGKSIAVGLLGWEERPDEVVPNTRLVELPTALDGGCVDFRQAVFATSGAGGSGWEVKGPRTASWVLQRISEQGPRPVHRHYWWTITSFSMP